jgi:hypothetical protein
MTGNLGTVQIWDTPKGYLAGSCQECGTGIPSIMRQASAEDTTVVHLQCR